MKYIIVHVCIPCCMFVFCIVNNASKLYNLTCLDFPQLLYLCLCSIASRKVKKIWTLANWSSFVLSLSYFVSDVGSLI